MNRYLTSSLVAALLLASVPAQSYFMPSDTPSTGTCNTIPFGQTSTIYQTLAAPSDLGNSAALRICDLAFAPCAGGNVHFGTIEITLAQSTSSTLSTTFTANLMQNAQVVLKATDYDWPVTANVWNRLGFDTDYQYVAGNFPYLVVQIVATGIVRTGGVSSYHRDGTHQRMYSNNWSGTPPATGSYGVAGLKFELLVGSADVSAYGVGCSGSAGIPTMSGLGDGKINGSFGVSVDNCPANAPVLHVFGLTRYEPRIDLAILGAPSCYLYQPISILTGGAASPTGNYSWRTPIPNDTTLLCARIYTQVSPADAAANTWGRTTSNYVRLLVGQ
ncbi:MAG: hypothetical protein KDC87_00345 [Planctomycetes bacterium]|nr:hypothetical protein [Planctomycetota bacterium]MCB9869813.1 hypothetical protein [Planctomycetota bacterium]